MAENFKQLTFKANDYLLKEGRQGDAAYLILRGKVDIRLGAFGDNPQTLATLGKGEVIGEMALFDNHNHMASAIAMEETIVGVLTPEDFQQRIEKMDPLMRGILKIMVKRLRKVGEEMTREGVDVNWSNWKKS